MKKILILAIILFSASQTSSFNLDSLLIKSLGGEKALISLRNLQTYQSSGKVTLNDQSGSFRQLYIPPDKFYLEIDLVSFSMIQAYDGQTAWQKGLNGQITELVGMEKKDMLKNLYLESISYLIEDRLPGSKEYIGIKQINGLDYHEVAFYPFNSDTVLVYYDIENGLKKIMINRLDMITSRTTIDDQRLIDDILFPFYTKATIEGISFSTTFEVDSIILNQSFDNEIFSMPSNKISDYHFPENKEQVIISFEYHNGHIKIPAVINGRKKVTFILDSGASANIFHKQAVEEMNLEVVGSIPSIGIGGFEDVALVKIDSLSIGRLTLYNMIAGKMDLGPVATAFQTESDFGGLLGYDFLSRFPILIDYQQSQLIVFNPDNFNPPDEGVEIPFHLTMQIPTITAEINGISGDFIVDLGNAFGLVLHHDFVSQNELENVLSDIRENPRLVGGVGGALKGKNAYVDSLKMGDILIQSLRVLLPDSSLGISGSKLLAGNIGNKIFENFKLLFDYQNNRLIFYKINP